MPNKANRRGGPGGSGACAQTQELGRGRPSYEEASDDATTNTDPAVDPTHHSNIPSFQDSSLCPSLPNKANRGRGGPKPRRPFFPGVNRPRCAKCIFLLSPALIHSSREMTEPQSILPLCLNHARTPGVVREVHPCECCRNFEARREPSRGSTPPPRPGPEVKYIPLGQREFAIVDAADFDWLNRYTWRLLARAGGRGLRLPGRTRQENLHAPRDHADAAGQGGGPQGPQSAPQPAQQPVELHGAGESAQSPVRSQPIRLRRGSIPMGRSGEAEVHQRQQGRLPGGLRRQVEAAKARDRKAYELFGPFIYLNFPDEIHAKPAGPARTRWDGVPC